MVGNLQIRITDSNDRPIGQTVHVQLLSGGGGGTVTEGYSNKEGMLSFSTIPVGSYHIVVSGDGLETTDSGYFEVDERKSTQDIFIRVKRTADENAAPTGGGSTVAVRDLNIPQAASEEFDRASEAMSERKWKKAVERLSRAVLLYPKYVAAYNNLGAAYMRLNEPAQEREAWQKAIEIDGHFAPSLLNLGRLSIIEKKYPEAEDLLGRASASDPTNPEILMLWAQSQLLDKHYDQAIASKDKVHALPNHEKYALAHYIAARAYAHENRTLEAAGELQTFLKEQPQGPVADAVRKELDILQRGQVVSKH